MNLKSVKNAVVCKYRLFRNIYIYIYTKTLTLLTVNSANRIHCGFEVQIQGHAEVASFTYLLITSSDISNRATCSEACYETAIR